MHCAQLLILVGGKRAKLWFEDTENSSHDRIFSGATASCARVCRSRMNANERFDDLAFVNNAWNSTG